MKNIENKSRKNDFSESLIWFVSKPLFSTVFFPEHYEQIKLGR